MTYRRQKSDLQSVQLNRLKEALVPVREALTSHPVYARLTTLEALRGFMGVHVFAVWDFMNLLKSLQLVLTSVQIPWYPPAFPEAARLINEIVLAEESDDIDGGVSSHFAYYVKAMGRLGADTAPINRLIDAVKEGSSYENAIAAPDIAVGPKAFLRSTLDVIRGGKPHEIAAAFTFGREDVIPDMFVHIVDALHQRFPEECGPLIHYLNRHIDLDGEEHGPMAHAMLGYLCGEDEAKWKEAQETAIAAIQARLNLWNFCLDII